jgi:uncharacterized protein
MKNTNTLALIIFFFFVKLTWGFSQNNANQKLQLISKSKNGVIHLRWVPNDATSWKIGNEFGYTLEKTLIKKAGKPLKVAKLIETVSISTNSKQEWIALAKKDDYAKVINGYFYDEPITSSDTSVINNAWRGRYIFSMLCADFSPQVAKGLGLFWVDTNVKPDEIYRYRVSLNTSDGKPSTTSVEIATGLSLHIPAELPSNFSDIDYIDSTVVLQWDIPKRTIYSAYNIERSDDGGQNFKKVNESPIYPTGNGNALENVQFSNKVPELFKTYQYRVKGIDPFSDESEPSKIVKVFAYQTRITGVQNQTYDFPSQEKVLLTWNYPDSLYVNLRGFHVYRVSNDGEEKLTEKVIDKSKNFYVDPLRPLDQSIIYSIRAVDLRAKETASEPLLVIVVDSIPPKKVTNLSGKINKEGIVTLHWTKSPDADLFSYDIFRVEGNEKSEMFPIKQIVNRDTTFIDTVSMTTSSKYVQYLVVPADFRTNICGDNDTLLLKRPDVIPPNPPNFYAASYSDSTITIKWILSTSEDVVNYKLYRTLPTDISKKLLLEFSTADSIVLFTDKFYEEELPILYVLEAIDDAELTSGDSAKLALTIPKPLRRQPVNDVNALYNKNEKYVQLQWKYLTKMKITKYIILRRESEKDEFKKIANIEGNITEFKDTTIKSDKTYEYILYAYLADKTISKEGTPVKIKVK